MARKGSVAIGFSAIRIPRQMRNLNSRRWLATEASNTMQLCGCW
jgi:hypothetical protein